MEFYIAVVRKCEQLKVIIDASRLGENYSEFPPRAIAVAIHAHMSMLGCCTPHDDDVDDDT